jgi:hypothetical protein
MIEALRPDLGETKQFSGIPGQIQDLMEAKDFGSVRTKLLELFSNLGTLTTSFGDLSNTEVSVIHLVDYIKWYHSINTFENGVILVSAIDILVCRIDHKLETVTKQNMVALLAILYLPILREPETSMLVLPKICRVLASFTLSDRFEFALVVQKSIQLTSKVATEKGQTFKTLVLLFQQHLTLQLLSKELSGNEEIHEDAINAVQTLGIFGKLPT